QIMHAINRNNAFRIVPRGHSTRLRLSCGGLAMSLFRVMRGPAIADYQFTVIDLASPNATYVMGINNIGQIVGAFEDDSHHTHGFLDGVTIDVPGATNTSVNGINDAGQVVGNYSGDHYISRGFMWSSDGGFTTIDVSEVVDQTFANGINNADQI